MKLLAENKTNYIVTNKNNDEYFVYWKGLLIKTRETFYSFDKALKRIREIEKTLEINGDKYDS